SPASAWPRRHRRSPRHGSGMDGPAGRAIAREEALDVGGRHPTDVAEGGGGRTPRPRGGLLPDHHAPDRRSRRFPAAQGGRARVVPVEDDRHHGRRLGEALEEERAEGRERRVVAGAEAREDVQDVLEVGEAPASATSYTSGPAARMSTMSSVRLKWSAIEART